MARAAVHGVHAWPSASAAQSCKALRTTSAATTATSTAPMQRTAWSAEKKLNCDLLGLWMRSSCCRAGVSMR